MIILGIETSCDETSIAIVADGRKILSNIISSSLHLHKKYGGVVPEIACRHHTEVINFVLEEALDKAKVKLSDIDAISVTQGPGLVGALLIGISLAKALSYSLKIPIIPANHLHGHIYSAILSDERSLDFPAIGLIVSGGHSSLVEMNSIFDIKLLGQTRDDACGEAFDKVAKILGLGFPGGPIIEKKAESGDPEKIKFPRSYLEKDSLDFSFSGIKTAVLYYVQDLQKRRKRIPKADIAAGFQEAMIDMLIAKTKTCCLREKAKRLFVGGGVSANSPLRKRLKQLAAHLNMDIFFPPKGMYMDNAAMIAGLGFHLFKKKRFADYRFSADPNLSF
ncbi:tRNA (adenosine(37)-N6)-threonylcarbamoyltransferase complex transferase subunit TsaD [Candidatus Omnitrophota bacterium]